MLSHNVEERLKQIKHSIICDNYCRNRIIQTSAALYCQYKNEDMTISHVTSITNVKLEMFWNSKANIEIPAQQRLITMKWSTLRGMNSFVVDYMLN